MKKIILLLLIGISVGTYAQKPCTPPTVSLTGPSETCSGDSITLSAAATGTTPYTYLWEPGGQTTYKIAVTPPGTTTYTCTVSNSCGTVSAIITVTVDNPSLFACCDDTIKAGHDTILVASGSSDIVSYSWSPAGTCLSASCDSVKVSPVITTNYTVTATTNVGCQVERVLTVVVDPSAIPTISGTDFVNVYPNPSSTEFTIDLQTKAKIDVCDITGRLLFSKEENAGTISFGKELNPGMYFLFINGKPGVKVVKL